MTGIEGTMHYKSLVDGLTVTGSYRYALFYRFPGGLRFELSEDGSPLDLVLTALRKATLVCEDIFDGRNAILVHLQRFVTSSRHELRSSLRALRGAGISVPKRRDTWREAVDDSDDFGAGYWVNCAFELPTAKLQSLLWCALVTDFRALRPNPQCLVYLADAATGILVHPYDDRGMDIICRDSSRLQGLYRKHNRWLLDHDREAMTMRFERDQRG